LIYDYYNDKGKIKINEENSNLKSIDIPNDVNFKKLRRKDSEEISKNK